MRIKFYICIKDKGRNKIGHDSLLIDVCFCACVSLILFLKRRREQLLAVSQNDIRQVAEQYLKTDNVSMAILGEANDKFMNDSSWAVQQFGQ